MNNDNLYQVVTLVLADGRRVSFTGKYQIGEDDRVVSVECTPARPLPKGMVFDRMMDHIGDDNAAVS